MDERPLAARLTPRERQIANLIALGSTNRQIAIKLSISERTVTAHVQNIFNKLGASNRAQVAAWSTRDSLARASVDRPPAAPTPTPVPGNDVIRSASGSRQRLRVAAAVLAALAIVVAASDDGSRGRLPGITPGPREASADQIVVLRGSSIQIAVVLPFSGESQSFGEGAWNAVQLAADKQPRIQGFSIRLNKFNGPCGPDDGLNMLAADNVVANKQNVAVIGHFCSNHFIEALPVYDAAGVVTVSASATNPSLPQFGPSVFNTVAISDACCPYQDKFNPWYGAVSELPMDVQWRQHDYTLTYGMPPPDYADLYYDAASLLITEIERTAAVDSSGNLVIDRPVLAKAVRAGVFSGVTCDVAFSSNGFRVEDPAAIGRCASKNRGT